MTGKELAIPEPALEGKVLGVPFSVDGCEPESECYCIRWVTAEQAKGLREAYKLIGEQWGW